MRAAFYLIDLVSQCAAVERPLAGKVRGSKDRLAFGAWAAGAFSQHRDPQVFHFTSTVGLAAKFLPSRWPF